MTSVFLPANRQRGPKEVACDAIMTWFALHSILLKGRMPLNIFMNYIFLLPLARGHTNDAFRLISEVFFL
jgi:hypothetical protein